MARKKRRTTISKKTKRSLPPELLKTTRKEEESILTQNIETVPPIAPAFQHSDLHLTWAARQQG